MKKLLIILLLIVGCDYAPTEPEYEYDYMNLSWASSVTFDSYLDSTYHFEDLDTAIVMVIDTIIYVPTFTASCFYVDTSNQCSNLITYLVYNNYTEDTTIYRKWTEIRLPNNQADLNEVTIELISRGGLVNPVPGIDYYEYK